MDAGAVRLVCGMEKHPSWPGTMKFYSILMPAVPMLQSKSHTPKSNIFATLTRYDTLNCVASSTPKTYCLEHVQHDL